MYIYTILPLFPLFGAIFFFMHPALVSILDEKIKKFYGVSALIISVNVFFLETNYCFIKD